jgi:hypothetical protein
MLPVVEDGIEPHHVVEEREERECEEDPADRVPRLGPYDHVADGAVRGQHDQGDPVVRRPGVVRHRGQREAGGEKEHDRGGRGDPDAFVARWHGWNLRPPALRDRYAS